MLCAVQSRASYYAPYATRLASWGYAVLQYDTPLLAMPDTATEVRPRGGQGGSCSRQGHQG
jgi:hypothetical protein